MRMPYIIACGMLALAACAYTDPILLRHPETGKIVQCGPYPTGGIQDKLGKPVTDDPGDLRRYCAAPQ